MFLKNDSNFQCGLRTKKEVLTIRPQEVVHVLDADIININSKLVKVSERDYEEFIKANKTEQVALNLNEVSKNEEQVNNPVPDKCGNCYADGKNPDQEKCERCNDPEATKKDEQNTEAEMTEDQTEDQAVVEGQENIETLESLEAKLEALKTKWQETTRPNRKEAIQKQIKEVQEKINKLK